MFTDTGTELAHYWIDVQKSDDTITGTEAAVSFEDAKNCLETFKHINHK